VKCYLNLQADPSFLIAVRRNERVTSLAIVMDEMMRDTSSMIVVGRNERELTRDGNEKK